MTKVFTPRGVCSRKYEIDIEDGIVKDVRIEGGCNGNLKGIAALMRGRKVEELIGTMSGIKCGPRATSCPDQISIALREALEEERGAVR